MQRNELVGVWKLESRAGKLPADLGVKDWLHQFKEDGTVIVAGIHLSQFPGVLPETKYRDKGTWQLEADILELTFSKGSFKSQIAIDDDILEMTFIYTEENSGKDITARHKRVDL